MHVDTVINRQGSSGAVFSAYPGAGLVCIFALNYATPVGHDGGCQVLVMVGSGRLRWNSAFPDWFAYDAASHLSLAVDSQ